MSPSGESELADSVIELARRLGYRMAQFPPGAEICLLVPRDVVINPNAAEHDVVSPAGGDV